MVALTDQWYLSYGDEQWRSLISAHVHSDAFNSYNAPLLESFEKAIDWLKEWACSREFGLGTQLPWDTKWVIDSLSDSTVYMALYTIAHRYVCCVLCVLGCVVCVLRCAGWVVYFLPGANTL